MILGVCEVGWSAGPDRQYQVTVTASEFIGTLYVHDGPTVSHPVLHTEHTPHPGPLNLSFAYRPPAGEKRDIRRLLVSVDGDVSRDVQAKVVDVGGAFPVATLTF